MELDIRQTELSFWLILRQNSILGFSNFNSKSIVTPSNFLWEFTV